MHTHLNFEQLHCTDGPIEGVLYKRFESFCCHTVYLQPVPFRQEEIEVIFTGEMAGLRMTNSCSLLSCDYIVITHTGQRR